MRYSKIFILCILFLYLTTFAVLAIPPISHEYKQGVYKMSSCSGHNVVAECTSENTINHIIILDAQYNIKFSQKLTNQQTSTCKIPIENNDSIVIIGEGEISLIFSK